MDDSVQGLLEKQRFATIMGKIFEKNSSFHVK